jgi:hypothetical protein
MRIARSLAVVVVVVALGCDGRDARLARIAEEAATRQAEQNREMARVQNEATKTVQSALDEQRQGREAFAATQEKLQTREVAIDQRFDAVETERQALETERRAIADDRAWDAQAASMLEWLGLTLIALSPLLLVGWMARHALSEQGDLTARDEVVIETLRPIIEHAPPVLLSDETQAAKRLA